MFDLLRIGSINFFKYKKTYFMNKTGDTIKMYVGEVSAHSGKHPEGGGSGE